MIRRPARWLFVALSLSAVALAGGCRGSESSPPFQPGPPAPAPLLACPAGIEVESPDGQAVVVSFQEPAVEGGLEPFTRSCSPESGASFDVGTTTVTCGVIDALFRSATCSFPVSVLGPPRLTATRFMAFGDSITEGAVSPAPTTLALIPGTAYPDRLAASLSSRFPGQASQIRIFNRGIGGELAERGASRLPGVLAADTPEVLLLMEGTNDLFVHHEGAYHSALTALEQMVLVAKGRGVQVVLATIPPQRPGGQRHRDRVAALIPGFNDRIRALAQREGVALAEVFHALEPNLHEYIGIDDLHPTVAGYDAIARVFFDVILEQFETRAP